MIIIIMFLPLSEWRWCTSVSFTYITWTVLCIHVYQSTQKTCIRVESLLEIIEKETWKNLVAYKIGHSILQEVKMGYLQPCCYKKTFDHYHALQKKAPMEAMKTILVCAKVLAMDYKQNKWSSPERSLETGQCTVNNCRGAWRKALSDFW